MHNFQENQEKYCDCNLSKKISSILKNLTTMPICAYPQVRIYEDFDKMSAKEVYFNEAGKKVTVKLLHFPDIDPEKMDTLPVVAEEERRQQEIINGNVAKALARRPNVQDILAEHADEDEDKDEDEDEDTKEADEQESEQQGTISAAAGGGIGSPLSSSTAQNRKLLRKKSGGHLAQPRRASKAFVEAQRSVIDLSLIHI